MNNDKVTLFNLLTATAAHKNNTAITGNLRQEEKPVTVPEPSKVDIPDYVLEPIPVLEKVVPAHNEQLKSAADFLGITEEEEQSLQEEEAIVEDTPSNTNELDEFVLQESNMRLFASNKQEMPALEIKPISEVTSETDLRIENKVDLTDQPVVNEPEITFMQTAETIETTDDSLEFLDDPDNFDTDDIDEAYRKRLVALGLESVDPIADTEEELEADSTAISDDSEEVDEALSKVFSNPIRPNNIKANTQIEEVPVELEGQSNLGSIPIKEHFSPLDFRVESEPNTVGISNSNGVNSAVSKDSMLQQFKQLQDRNSTFVFMFGRQQAGKTVILSSLAYHMGIDENGLLETRRRVDNLKGAAYLKQLSESVRKGQFMNRTSVGSLYELDLTYTPNKPEIPMNFTFLEMSGEDLTKVELSEASAGNLPSDIEVYLKCPNLNLIFMLVVPYEDAEEHDYLVIDFLDYLKERKPDFDFSKLLLLISKWDRYEGLRKDEVDVFVKEQMPRTYSRLKAKKATIARYSIGEVSDDNNQILDLNMERPEVVKRWLYNAATGEKIKDKSASIWGKIKQWV